LHHAKTSVVAEIDGVLVGAVTGYIPPGQPDSLFIWQVAVAPQLRGQGLARLMLEYLRRTCVSENKLLWIETTISPSNTASHHLFTSFTLQHDVGCAITTLFSAELFGESGHEEEKLYRIGPWDRSR
jgi:L-2,4-diaminobutyric acid acetyltransferase